MRFFLALALFRINRRLRMGRRRRERRAPRLHCLGQTARLIRGSIGPEADWHGRYEAGG